MPFGDSTTHSLHLPCLRQEVGTLIPGPRRGEQRGALGGAGRLVIEMQFNAHGRRTRISRGDGQALALNQTLLILLRPGTGKSPEPADKNVCAT